MRILQINKYNYLRGGVDTVFFNTIQLLEEHGHGVARLCVGHPKNEPSPWERYFADAPEIRDIKGVVGKLRSVPRFFVNRDAAQKIEQLINDFRPDVAHLHNIFNGLSLAILPVLRRHGIPVVITMHDTRFICPTSLFKPDQQHCATCLQATGGLRCGLRRCYQGSFVNSWMCAFEMFHKERIFHYDDFIDRYIFLSQRYLDFHSLRHSYFGEKGEVLPNFAAMMHQATPSEVKGGYMLYYGRVTVEKGIATLMEAMRRRPDVQLRVVGTGPMEEQMKAMGLPNVEFMGYKSGPELFDQVKNASFIVVPSEWEENNPMTIIEAYTYGKPVIGSSLGGIPEIVEEGKTGYVFQEFSGEALVRAIGKAASVGEEQYRQMSRMALAYAREKFSPEHHYARLVKIYEDAISRKSKINNKQAL